MKNSARCLLWYGEPPVLHLAKYRRQTAFAGSLSPPAFTAWARVGGSSRAVMKIIGTRNRLLPNRRWKL